MIPSLSVTAFHTFDTVATFLPWSVHTPASQSIPHSFIIFFPPGVLFIPTAPPGLSLMVQNFSDLNDILVYSCNSQFATVIWSSQALLQPVTKCL